MTRRELLALMAGVPAWWLSGCDTIRRIDPSGDAERVVEVALFEGGYGTHWHKRVAEQYSEARRNEGVRVYLWGDQRVEEIVKPRLLRGDPPELVLAGNLPIWRLIANAKLFPFDEALAESAYGADQPWGELFIPGTLDMYATGDGIYAIPSSFSAWACWYDARMFRDHGWQVPATWSEFEALCEACRAAGIAPLAFQGKYPLYAWWTYISLIQRCGGLAELNRINAVEPGAFSQPGALWAAQLVQEMAQKYFQRGAMAMTHTESQLQFVRGQAALMFCGVWLENEMRASIPPGYEMRCFNVPAVEGGKGNPRLFNGEGGEFLFAPADARFPELGMDFCRYLVSPLMAPDMGATIGNLSPMQGATPRDVVSPALQSVLDMMDSAPGIFGVRLPTLMQRWTNGVLVPGLSHLMRGEVTPEEFGRVLDAGLDVERSDPDVFIPGFVAYDPAQYGEKV